MSVNETVASTTADPLAAWNALPPGVRDEWKISPDAVLSVQRTRGASQQYVCLTATYRYCWTFVPSRMAWTVRKTARA